MVWLKAYGPGTEKAMAYGCLDDGCLWLEGPEDEDDNATLQSGGGISRSDRYQMSFAASVIVSGDGKGMSSKRWSNILGQATMSCDG
jgi:hypothetical protein